MRVETANLLDLRIPPDDDAIARAFTNLETKLVALTTFVEDLQKKLSSRPVTPAKADNAIDRTESDEIVVAEKTSSAVTNCKNEPLAKKVEAEPVLHETIETAESEKAISVKDEETLLLSLEADMATAIRQEHEQCAGRKSISQLIEEHKTRAAEEEALLKSLPPDAANDIRVQYRFFNGRKSIRELVEAYQAEPTREKNSWWKRAKG